MKGQPPKVVKKTTVVKTKSSNPADSYPANKDKRGVPTIGGGEGTRPPFKSGGKVKKGAVSYKQAQKAAGYKSGGKMGKCRGGC